jgi:hypothetical protein
MSKPYFRNGLADLQIEFDVVDLRGGEKVEIFASNWCSKKCRYW